MRGDVELLQEQAVAEVRSGKVRVENGKAHQLALQLGHQAKRAAMRRRHQEGRARPACAPRNSVAVVVLVLLEQMGEMSLVALSRVSDLHGGWSNTAGPGQQRRPKSPACACSPYWRWVSRWPARRSWRSPSRPAHPMPG